MKSQVLYTVWYAWGKGGPGGVGKSGATEGLLGNLVQPLIFFTNVPIPEDETLTNMWHFQNF